MAKSLSPDEIFDAAVAQSGPNLAPGGLRLLRSGLELLKKKEPTLRKNELIAIYSLIAYVAYEQKICETTVAAVLLAKFGGEEIKSMPSSTFQPAVNFLVDLKMDKVIN
jgi:hypothetical protein